MSSDDSNPKDSTPTDPAIDPNDCGCDAPPPPTPDLDTDETVDQTDPEAAETATDDLMKWRDMALRTAAEYDNYRKRCVKERDDFTRYASRALIEELLPVIDNFEMGMTMAQQDTKSMIYIGMSMVQKQLHDFLDNQGVKVIEAEIGDAFDHNKHEAIQSEASDLAEGSIVRVVRKGYLLKDKLLRPVNVVTAAAAEEA